MCHDFALAASFFSFLRSIDAELAEQCRAARCPWCGGILHSAAYRRKPRGVHRSHLEDGDAVRHSFCCARQGCRRRCTPASVRFLGRRVYFGFFLVLSCSVSVRRVMVMGRELSVPAHTIRRWRCWWQQCFVQLSGWRTLRLRLSPPIDPEQLPEALWARFGALDERTLVKVLREVSRTVHPAKVTLIQG